MRVLVGPRTDLERDRFAAGVAGALAGSAGEIVSLREVGVRTLARPLSQAEVALLRHALRPAASRTAVGHAAGAFAAGAEWSREEESAIVGYLCRGALLAARLTGGEPAKAAEAESRLVAVTDHADLTWRSPLVGPNDASIGPRFPSTTGVYSPETILDRLGAVEGMIVEPGVVAGVRDDARPTAYEAGMAAAQGHAAVSSELAPVIVVAAHLGLRVAAVLVTGT